MQIRKVMTSQAVQLKRYDTEQTISLEVQASSSHMCCVELVLKGVLCTRLGSKGQTTESYFCPTNLTRATKTHFEHGGLLGRS